MTLWKWQWRVQYRVRRTRGWAAHVIAAWRHQSHPRTVWCGSYHCPYIPDQKASASEAVATDEQAEAWLKTNDLYAVTHIHTDDACGECRLSLVASDV